MLKKILLGLLILIVVVVAGFFIFVQISWNKTYDIPYPDLEVSTDSAIIARGEYLALGPAHCIGCHLKDLDAFIRAEEGEFEPLQGGVELPLGPIGTVYPPNLTPDKETGIGRYSDGQIFRMMRHAVKPDGMASLSLMMPFWNMADEDLIAIVSYLRSLDPVYNEVSMAQYTFMGKAIRSFTPLFKPVYDPTPPEKAPPMEPTVERGEYLARYVANCVGCHTNRDPATFKAIGPEFAGGFEMEPLEELNLKYGIDPDIWTRSTNITSHPNSALSKFQTLEEWKTRFRAGRLIINSPMDWGAFSRMTDEDLEALWVFLHSLDPVENDVGPVVFKKSEKPQIDD